MSEKYSQPTLELSRTFEGWYLPQRPLCCDDDYSQLVRRSRTDALRCKHVEANPAALVNMIVFSSPSTLAYWRLVRSVRYASATGDLGCSCTMSLRSAML